MPDFSGFFMGTFPVYGSAAMGVVPSSGETSCNFLLGVRSRREHQNFIFVFGYYSTAHLGHQDRDDVVGYPKIERQTTVWVTCRQKVQRDGQSESRGKGRPAVFALRNSGH